MTLADRLGSKEEMTWREGGSASSTVSGHGEEEDGDGERRMGTRQVRAGRIYCRFMLQPIWTPKTAQHAIPHQVSLVRYAIF